MVAIDIVKYFLFLYFKRFHAISTMEAMYSPGNALVNNFLEKAGIC
jgi:hypothetical protein